jgi:glucose-6-phosphate 1-dehydrogenase
MRQTTDDYCIVPGQPAPPSSIVIFGATGDLAKRKLLPALANLHQAKLLPQDFTVIGVGRDSQAMGKEAFAARVAEAMEAHFPPATALASRAYLAERLQPVAGGFDDPATYRQLGQALEQAGQRFGTRGSAVFYLATPPGVFPTVVEHLSKSGLLEESGGRFRRVIIEKPFGRDLASARALNRRLQELMREEQAYRIDHYLGKETVQNILVFRFGNGIFEPVWDRRYVDHVQITMAEDIGVEQRGPYYEGAGALRDMVQNHLFQLLSLIAMEPPASFGAEAVRDEKAKLLSSLQPMAPEQAVRGQYGPGDRAAKGYRQEARVAPDSQVETFTALRAQVDNWRWAGVPFYLRTGKALARRRTEIVIQFKAAPHQLFRGAGGMEALQGNRLVMQIAPREGISLVFAAKQPGPGLKLGKVQMDFGYAEYFGTKPHTGYETLLYDCLCGDATLFQRADTVELGWQAIQPLLDAWAGDKACPLSPYPAGSWGPPEADALLERDGRAWKNR